MQSLRSTRAFCARSRYFGSTAARRNVVPWFVDPLPTFTQRNTPPHLTVKSDGAVLPVPEDAPEVIKFLHSQLLQSPHLEKSELVVSPAVLPEPGPALPLKAPQGRRRRGGIYGAESGYDAVSGGVWSWVVMSQVKEGTENRGAIESVVRLVRTSLLKYEPPVPLPPKSRRKDGGDWVMIDAGKFAVHILTRASRQKYFSKGAEW